MLCGLRSSGIVFDPKFQTCLFDSLSSSDRVDTSGAVAPERLGRRLAEDPSGRMATGQEVARLSGEVVQLRSELREIQSLLRQLVDGRDSREL